MVDYFIKTPFALNGQKTAIDDGTQPSGIVSFDEGYGVDYELDPSDPDVLYPERRKMNYLFNVITTLINQWQVHGYPNFITTVMNGGSPYSYDINAYTRFDDGNGPDIYYSLVNANVADPTDATKWARVAKSSVPTGSILEFQGASLPSGGWIWPDGGTVGNGSSNGTNRANADTLNLFTQIWTDYPNSVRPIYDSAGVATTRGFTAAADFAANKALPVTDRRGRSGIGKDNMGGTAANRITTAGCAIDGTVLGADGGAQNVSLTAGQNGQHTHTIGTLVIDPVGNHTHTVQTANGGGSGGGAQYGGVGSPILTDGAGAHTHTFSGALANSGSGTAHLNVQPGIVQNYILKL